MKSFIIVLLGLLPIVVLANNDVIEKNGVRYVLDTQKFTAAVTYYGDDYIFAQNQYKGSVSIPSEIDYSDNTFIVTAIGEGAFYYCDSLEIIQLPNTITAIGSYAFSGCVGLKAIDLPETIATIGDNAFACCTGLTDIKLPNKLNNINNNLFLGCASLLNISLPENCSSIGESAFEGCKLIEGLQIPEAVISIGKGAFKECTNLNSIILPPSIKIIENELFNGCVKLKKIVIPNEVESIGASAFEEDAALAEIEVGANIKSIGERAFRNCKKIVDVKLPSGFKSLGKSSFYGCSSLESISFYEGLEKIEDETFWGCYALKDISLPNGITSIGKFAFSECRSLTSLSIPEGVTSIADAAFRYSSKIESISFPSTLKKIGKEAFYGCMIKSILSNSAEGTIKGAFSENTMSHAILYIPSGKWKDAVYNSEWYLVNNIKEIAIDNADITESTVYSLMNSNCLDYIICADANGGYTSTVDYETYDANDTNHCWQIKRDGNRTYLFNIGVKKYITGFNGTSFALSDIGSPAEVTATENGFIISSDVNKWYLVINGKNTTQIQNIDTDDTNNVTYTTLDGVKHNKLQKGINIIRSKNITKKVIVR